MTMDEYYATGVKQQVAAGQQASPAYQQQVQQGQNQQSTTALMDQLKAMQAQYAQSQATKETQQLGYLSGAGTAAKLGINQNADRQIAGSQSNLASRGLGNSTIVNSVNQGIETGRQNSLAGVDESTGLAKANVIGNRPISSDNYGLYGSLLSSLGNNNSLGNMSQWLRQR